MFWHWLNIKNYDYEEIRLKIIKKTYLAKDIRNKRDKIIIKLSKIIKIPKPRYKKTRFHSNLIVISLLINLSILYFFKKYSFISSANCIISHNLKPAIFLAKIIW